tara:strand:- start:103 stop:501 length:399 start_codon:yes stop_codon:yes gene_type:complete
MMALWKIFFDVHTVMLLCQLYHPVLKIDQQLLLTDDALQLGQPLPQLKQLHGVAFVLHDQALRPFPVGAEFCDPFVNGSAGNIILPLDINYPALTCLQLTHLPYLELIAECSAPALRSVHFETVSPCHRLFI